MADKLYIDAQQLLEDSFELAWRVYNSGFSPTFIAAVWRGGAPMGMAVQELFAYHGVETDHIAIRASSYRAIDQQADSVRVIGLNYLTKKLTRDDRLLIVDDVFDTGRSIDAIIDELSRRLRKNLPADIRIALPYYKPSRNQSTRVPDYYLHETSAWLKFPHSLEGLTEDEIRRNRPRIHQILQSAKR